MTSKRSRHKTSFRQEPKKKNHESLMEYDDDDTRGVSLRCLSLYNRAGGCKVGAATSDEFGEIGKGFEPKDTSLDCFSYGFWKRNNKKKNLETKDHPMHVFLPDDILEMCLARLPLTSLMNARLVCKKWKTLTTTDRFLRTRRTSPWVFLFGTVKDGYCSRQIHAFDVSCNKWHTIAAAVLGGRFSFSTAAVYDRIFIVGGCSSLTDCGKLDRSLFKTHKGVLVFSPSTKSWHKVASMKHARSNPVLGVYQVNSDRLTVKRRQSRIPNEKNFLIVALGGVGSWDEPLDSCEIYDSSSNKWMEIQQPPIEFGIACSGVVCNGTFYVYSETDKLAAYDIELGFWVRLQTAPVPPRIHEYHPRLVSCDNQRVFMVSVSWCEGVGAIGRRNKAVRKLWELDLVYLTWSEVSVHPDAPMDWNAGFVGDKNLVFGVEMFKIFGQVLEFLTMCDGSDPEMKWVHVSKNQVAREMDSASCVLKSMAVVHL